MTHVDRMEAELEELDKKIYKLKMFFYDELKEPKFTDCKQRELLRKQLDCMRGYQEFLIDRIEYDKGKLNEEVI